MGVGEDNIATARVTKEGVRLVAIDPATAEHELRVHTILGTRIAEMLDCRFQGVAIDKDRSAERLYLIPDSTLVGNQQRTLGIASEDDFFGGSVPFPFVATKVISHPLVSESATTPQGWSRKMMESADQAVLAGFSAFSFEDAHYAGTQLLLDGAVRIKPATAKAGRSQIVVRTAQQLDDALHKLGAAELGTQGVVLERDLENVLTLSVGQVRVAGIIASYCGNQTQTRDNDGEWVYGGSELLVVRGDYDSLLRNPLSQQAVLAVKQSRLYEHAALQAYPEILASRRNYDVLQGTDGRGRLLSGVLEQSWRIGGASSAEIYALELLARNPQTQRVRAASIERYGRGAHLPPDTCLLFHGEDPQLGYLTKGVRVLADDNTH